ncbi:transposase [Thermobifida halotolerans]|uniref:transposase n=1 Tax=Thermobifida halotolerans TaxID=483545 RepID=UPI0022770A9D|nr:transposase [Thermobifida halotolerans]
MSGGRRRCPAAASAAVVPRRWVVERTFAWLDRYRRTAKDYEYLASVSENVLYLAMSPTLLRRLSQLPK